MCGIFGFISNKNTKVGKENFERYFNSLFVLSESRGKESSGISIKRKYDRKINVYKDYLPASKLIRDKEFKSFLNNSFEGVFEDGSSPSAFSLIGHTRLVTNGSHNNNNNQPTVKNNDVVVHNGIITNIDSIWEKQTQQRNYEVDTEIIPVLLRKDNNGVLDFTNLYKNIEGTVSFAFHDSKSDCTFLGSNNGSLFYFVDTATDLVIFASEKFILEKFKQDNNLSEKDAIQQVLHDDIVCVDYTLNSSFDLLKATERTNNTSDTIYSTSDPKFDKNPIKKEFINDSSALSNMLEYNIEAIKNLKRCSKCVLPETFPFIAFDAKGVCNYCNSYVPKMQGDKEQQFKELMEGYKNPSNNYDCIIPFSGGRDSSYGLHYIVETLKMRPVTFTYDWGMVTDLARRNVARVCGKLNVENIIISADIELKRRNIHKNVKAWLKKPALGMIPLFMAGDKHFFYYSNQIKKQTGVKVDIWSTNILENTDFKTGFCGIAPEFDKNRPDHLSFSRKLRLLAYYGKNFITNPSYINSSLIDTTKSFLSYYVEPRTDFYQLFDWITWDEDKIESTLFNEYNWELSPDTSSSWRIGDGTAAFYNYIYYTVAGFTEFDTFRSNQIREGLITREKAMSHIYDENLPRFDSMLWYLKTIDIDFKSAIETVNKIKKLYEL